jgi:hypothetical protein
MQRELNIPEQFVTEQTEPAAQPTAATARKPFVEPDISAPVDVLEATTFFNTSTSGAAN